MNNPLGFSPSKGKQGTTSYHTRQRKILLTSVGIEPTTSGLDLPLLCRLSYKVPHEAKKNSFDLGGNRTHDLRIRSTVTLPTELQGVWFPVSLY